MRSRFRLWLCKRAALAWANDVRDKSYWIKDTIHELPRGVRRHPASCPLALATERPVYSCDVRRMPTLVREFVRRFDQGEYPKLLHHRDRLAQ